MTERGLVDVPDASARFLVDRRAGVPGSAVAAVLEGARPMLVEVQALVDAHAAARCRAGRPRARVGAPRDAARGARTAHAGEARRRRRLRERRRWAARRGARASTSRVALAVAGAQLAQADRRADTVAIGELGLGGEVRSVPQIDRRLVEAARLGFTACDRAADTERHAASTRRGRRPRAASRSAALATRCDSRGDPGRV